MTSRKLAITLKQLRESKGMTIKEVARQAGLGQGTVGDIETGRSSGSKRSIGKIAEVLNLTPEEKNKLDSAFLGREVLSTDDPRVMGLNKRERFQHDDFMKEAVLFFQDDKVSEEDKQKLMNSLQEAFFEIKLANKKK